MEKLLENKLKSHEDLIVWQKAMNLVEHIYHLTKKFPNSEQFGIIAQMRRSAVAIPANITEGYQRNHLKEYIQFLYISKSSAFELDTFLKISKRLALTNEADFKLSEELITEVLKMLTALINKLKAITLNPNPYPLKPTKESICLKKS